MTELEATVEIAKILAKLLGAPHHHPANIYPLVVRVTRVLLERKDSYERAVLEYDAIKVLREHYGV